MHEQSLMNNLMHKIQSIAHEQHATRVTHVHVMIGALAHMSPSHFREHFATASKGTLAENATLNIEENPDPYDKQAQDIRLVSIEVHDS